jgi:hypothetical protein
VEWTIINALLLASPLVLLWSWVSYLQAASRSDWRSVASLVGLSAPLLSGALWAVTLLLASGKGWHTATPIVEHLITVGVWIPIVGILIGLAGRPLLILAIVPSSIGTVLFWYATTLP